MVSVREQLSKGTHQALNQPARKEINPRGGKKARRAEVPAAVKKSMVEVNGPNCLCCSNSFALIDAYKTIDDEYTAGETHNVIHIHHITPLYALNAEENTEAEVMCYKCEHLLHVFIDIFRSEYVKYDFLTTVYIWLFAPTPSKELKVKYSPVLFGITSKDEKTQKKRLYDDFMGFINECEPVVKYLYYAYQNNWLAKARERRGSVTGPVNRYQPYNEEDAYIAFNELYNESQENMAFYGRYRNWFPKPKVEVKPNKKDRRSKTRRR